MEERRSCPRVEPVGDCIVVHPKAIGNIKNISRSGLFCSCYLENQCAEQELHRKIDILCGEGNFLVRNLRVKIIQMETSSGKILRELQITKCRMQFEDLREDQSFGIESILSGSCIQ